jgi:hypothetical protein
MSSMRQPPVAVHLPEGKRSAAIGRRDVQERCLFFPFSEENGLNGNRIPTP